MNSNPFYGGGASVAHSYIQRVQEEKKQMEDQRQ
jgi:hypothetical protein